MLEGHLLNDRYRIKRTIGGGGMANVYLARDLILNREVAIKVLRWEYANDPEFIERFDREAQAATSLSHPNIVNIYDVGEEEHILYMVMEYIDGLTLKEYIIQNGPLQVEEAIEIMKQLTNAISHAHANGLIHRDIKPQNVLIDKQGNVKVTDFGIALALSATALTQTNSVLGSVHYLSPEQARGGIATKKSDIYSLGIVLYELLTGQLPFSGQTPISIALKHLQDETPSVRALNSSIPQSVENIVLQATAKDPFHRYESVFAMESALHVALDPNYMTDEVFTPPVEEGEETKAIPIITDEQLDNYARSNKEDETIVHSTTKIVEPPKEEKEQKQSKKKKRSRLRKWLFSLGALVLLFIIFILFFVFNSPKDVVIPDVIGMEYEEAKDELEQLNLKVNKETVPSDDYEEGIVVKTDPTSGRTVKEKTTVDVFVSEGKEKIEFGDYVGENYNQVKRILEEAGYKEVRAYEKISDEPEGVIITQIQPEAGEEVVPSETTVIFEISGGLEKVALNDLRNLTLKQVENYAEENGFTLEVREEHSDSVKEGEIIRQSPEQGIELTKGSTVTVVVSKGKEPLPPKQHNVTFTVPYQPTDNGEAQTVKIYVEDENYRIDEVFHEDKITSDQEYTLSLVIAPNKQAQYKVVRDDKVIFHRTVDYQEGG